MAIVGIDLGTQSLKAVVCDDQLRVLGAHQVAYRTSYPQPGHAEQDPHVWEQALGPAISGALADAGRTSSEVTGLALAGQLDGCVAVDAHGAAVHPALIWQDRRADAHVRLVSPARLFELTGQIADPGHMAPKLRWLRAQKLGAVRYHQPTSYLVERITGAAVLDPSHASTTMLFDLIAGTWSRELLEAFEIDASELPTLLPTCALAGAITERGAELTGLRIGTPVAVGTGDDFATPLGAGIVAPGSIVCAIGTAEVVGTLADVPVFDIAATRAGPKMKAGGPAPTAGPKMKAGGPAPTAGPKMKAGGPAPTAGPKMKAGGPAPTAENDPWRALAEPMVETHAYPTGAFFVENPGWLSGGAIRWATQLLGLASDAELDALAATAPPGAAGVTFVPALSGAMTPTWRPHARGTFHGLSAAHDRSHLARAILEGLAFACRDVTQRLVALGLPAREVIVLGGGGHSAVWSQIRTDALGLPHHVAARADTCAIGAAMIAAVATNLIGSLVEAAALVPRPTASFSPRGSLDEAYARYCKLVAALTPLADQPWA